LSALRPQQLLEPAQRLQPLLLTCAAAGKTTAAAAAVLPHCCHCC
jgi:hypothetical protein